VLVVATPHALEVALAGEGDDGEPGGPVTHAGKCREVGDAEGAVGYGSSSFA
jgi:hypothetical protein